MLWPAEAKVPLLHAIVNETRQQDKTTFKQAIFHRFLVKEVVVMRPRLVVGGDLVKVMMEVVVPRQRLEQHRLSSNYTYVQSRLLE